MVEHAFITENFASWIITQMSTEFDTLPEYKKYQYAVKYLKRLKNQILPNMTTYSRNWLLEAREFDIKVFEHYVNQTKVYEII